MKKYIFLSRNVKYRWRYISDIILYPIVIMYMLGSLACYLFIILPASNETLNKLNIVILSILIVLFCTVILPNVLKYMIYESGKYEIKDNSIYLYYWPKKKLKYTSEMFKYCYLSKKSITNSKTAPLIVCVKYNGEEIDIKTRCGIFNTPQSISYYYKYRNNIIVFPYSSDLLKELKSIGMPFMEAPLGN